MTLRISGPPAVLYALALALAISACSPPLTEQELLARASTALDAGELAAAELDVKTALQSNPQSAEARVLYGKLYLRQLNPAAAVDEFERALRVDDSADTRLLLAKALNRAGESAELLSEYESGSFESIASDGEFQAVLARAYLAQQQYDDARSRMQSITAESDYIDVTRAALALQLDADVDTARSLLEKVLERSPDYADALSIAGGLALSSGDLASAEAFYKRTAAANPFRIVDRMQLVSTRIALGDAAGAELELKALERLIPRAPGVTFLRGQLFFDAGDYENALDYLSRTISVDPNHQRALMLAATANLREQNLATAQRQFTQLLTLQPGNVQAKLQLASVWWQLGEPGKTEALAREVLKEQDMNSSALGLLAMALAAQGMNAESASVYERLAQVEPESVEVLVGLGSQQLVAGQSEAAIEQLTAAVALDGNSALAHERLIEAQLVLANLDAAQAAAEAYIDAVPTGYRPYIFLGRVRLQQEDYDGARALFEKSLELEPGNRAASGGLAAIAVSNNDSDGAKTAFRDALKANPGDLLISMNLAALLEQSGDTDEMMRILEQTASSNPEAAEPRIALARLALAEGDMTGAIAWLAPLEEGSEDFRVQQLLTGAYLADGQNTQASNAARKLLALRGEDPAALGLIAKVESANNRPEFAQQHLEKALAAAPESDVLRRELIDVLVQQRKLDAVREQVALLSDEAQKATPVLVLRGRLAMAAGDAVAARPLFEQALEQQRNNININLLAGALWALGEREETLSLLENWLSDFPDDALTLNELAGRNLELGKEATAREQYASIVQLQPENVAALNNLAWLYRLDDNEAALDYIERAARLAPNSAEVLDTFAMVLLQRKEFDQALARIDSALAIAAENPEIRLNKARILVSAGRAGEARALLESLVAGPAFASQTEARELLQGL